MRCHSSRIHHSILYRNRVFPALISGSGRQCTKPRLAHKASQELSTPHCGKVLPEFGLGTPCLGQLHIYPGKAHGLAENTGSKWETNCQSLMRRASCQNSHWSTVTVSTKSQAEGGRPVFEPCAFALWESHISASGWGELLSPKPQRQAHKALSFISCLIKK